MTDQDISSKPAASIRPLCRGWITWALVALVACNSLIWGLQLRRWAWDQTTDIRFVNSVSNAIEWGRFANRIGVLNLYDDLIKKHGDEGDYEGPARFALDYPPLRLLIAAGWTAWAQEHYPPPRGADITWKPFYEFTEPMLQLNTACEIAATVAMFLLVYQWIRICHLPPSSACRWYQPWTWRRDWEQQLRTMHLPLSIGAFRATLAALLFWFNPALLWNSHVYPQWDCWVFPAFLFAAYFGLRRWWLGAGLVVGIIAMAKGQILIVLPVLLAWPLLTLDWWGLGRFLIGMLGGIALVVWPWELQFPAALAWLKVISISSIMTLAVFLPRSRWWWWLIRASLAIAGAVTIAWSVWGIRGDYMFPGTTSPLDKHHILLLFLGLVLFLTLVGRWLSLPTLLVSLWAGAVLLAIPLFGASTAWYEIGIVYGTRHWRHLFWCHASNLGSILEARFRWEYVDKIDLHSLIPWVAPTLVPLRQVMIWIYAVTLLFCLIGLARHLYRRDQRLFYVLAAPWMLMFAVLPQMIDRYLIWPAAIISAAAAVEFGGFILYLVLSLLAWVMMAEYMLGFVRNSPFARQWLPTLTATFPDIGWAVLVLAGVVLYKAVTASSQRYWEKPLPLKGAAK